VDVRFSPPENNYNAAQANSPALKNVTSLMRATRYRYATDKAYLNPSTYNHWSHTIVLNDDYKVHWFVLRAKRGDHPCMLLPCQLFLLFSSLLLSSPHLLLSLTSKLPKSTCTATNSNCFLKSLSPRTQGQATRMTSTLQSTKEKTTTSAFTVKSQLIVQLVG